MRTLIKQSRTYTIISKGETYRLNFYFLYFFIEQKQFTYSISAFYDSYKKYTLFKKTNNINLFDVIGFFLVKTQPLLNF